MTTPAGHSATQGGYPFAGIVGMADLKLALLLNAVSPTIGGVLVRGEKGTAKSTVVRGLAALLPPVPVIAGCRYSCDPAAPDPDCPSGPHPDGATDFRPVTLAELPVGATEDRLTGSLDIERVLTSGVTAFQPGLLADAHRGVLYVDEVNLLHDHLVDLLLDAAALGVNYVEREGVSVRHAARFLLVGTMNPEEGELRPQLLDRFGLTVEVAASRDPAERAEVVRRRLAFEADPVSFANRFAAETAALAAQVAAARARLGAVVLPDAALRQICAVCGAFGVDGMRADLVTARTAIALAAWHDRDVVTTEDVRTAARLALPHRRRRDPFDAPGLDEQALDEAIADATQPEDGPPDDDPDGPDDGGQPSAPDQSTGQQTQQTPARSGQRTSTLPPAAPFRARLLTVPGTGEGSPGRRSAARGLSGRTVAARVPASRRFPFHLPATIRAAAAATQPAAASPPNAAPLPATAQPAATPPTTPQPSNATPPPNVSIAQLSPLDRVNARRPLTITPQSLREAVREGREGNLVLFVVDASGSMAARERMRVVKAAILSLLLDAYQRRDKVGLVTFRGSTAERTLPPTSSVEAAARRLTTLPTGGRTPLAAGLAEAAHVLAAEQLRDPRRRPLLVLVTDGRATSGTDADLRKAVAMLHGTASVVIDCEDSVVRLGLAPRLAAALRAPVYTLDDLRNVTRHPRRAA